MSGAGKLEKMQQRAGWGIGLEYGPNLLGFCWTDFQVLHFQVLQVQVQVRVQCWQPARATDLDPDPHKQGGKRAGLGGAR